MRKIKGRREMEVILERHVHELFHYQDLVLTIVKRLKEEKTKQERKGRTRRKQAKRKKEIGQINKLNSNERK